MFFEYVIFLKFYLGKVNFIGIIKEGLHENEDNSKECYHFFFFSKAFEVISVFRLSNFYCSEIQICEFIFS